MTDGKRLYESILAGIADAVKDGLREAAFNQEIPEIPELMPAKRGRGRPRKGHRLANLYRGTVKQAQPLTPERVIQAFTITAVNKKGTPLYMNILTDVEQFRTIILNAISAAAKRYAIDPEALKDEYGLNDLDGFAQDIRDNYDELSKMYNFPTLVKKTAPISRRRRSSEDGPGLSKLEIEKVVGYMADYGEGLNVHKLSPEMIDELLKYTVKDDGFVYEVCRPIKPGMEDAPHLVYKRVGKFGEGGANLLRRCYQYQCDYNYGVYVNYYDVSAITLANYMEKEYWA